jgi:PAS domain S-box-containing protein
MTQESDQRERAEQAARASEAWFRVLFEEAPVGIGLSWDQSTLAVNQAYARMFGYANPQEILGTSLMRLLAPESQAEAARCIARLAESGRPEELELEGLRADGGRFSFLAAVGRFSFPDGPALVGWFQDLSEARRAQWALRESDRRFRDLLERVELLGVLIDEEGRATFVNDHAARLLGRPRNALEGRSWFAAALPPDEGPALEAAYREGLRSATIPPHFENAVLTASGERRMVRWANCVLRSEDGRVVGTASIGEDVTERLAAAARREQALREKEILLREIHHRVKNNLQIVGSLLYFQAKKVRDPESRRLIEEGQERLRAIQLVHDLLHRADGLDRVDLGAYLRALTAQTERAHARPGLPVRVEVKVPEGISLPADTAMPCGLVVAELLTNAFKHAFPGRPGRIEVEVAAGERALLLRVGDDGVGLPPDVDPSHPASFGLSLVDSLARQLGGAVRLERAGGTRVTLEFPHTQP